MSLCVGVVGGVVVFRVSLCQSAARRGDRPKMSDVLPSSQGQSVAQKANLCFGGDIRRRKGE
jgi:hypothetical protein